jgi:hypothetical protein
MTKTMGHPLVSVAYERWRHMEWRDVLVEAAVLFHLAVKIDDVKLLDAMNTKPQP